LAAPGESVVREFLETRFRLVGLMKLVLVVQRVQHQTASRRPDQHDVFPIMHRYFRNGVLLGFRKSRHEQRVRLADLLLVAWTIPATGTAGINRLDLGGGGIIALVDSYGQMLFRRDLKRPDPNAPWDEAMRQLREYTSICLPPQDRHTILLETQTEAQAHYAECEVSQGRPRPSRTP
jgi:hypothetical protein